MGIPCLHRLSPSTLRSPRPPSPLPTRHPPSQAPAAEQHEAGKGKRKRKRKRKGKRKGEAKAATCIASCEPFIMLLWSLVLLGALACIRHGQPAQGEWG